MPVAFKCMITKSSWRAYQLAQGSERMMERWLSRPGSGPNAVESRDYPWTLRDRFLRLHHDEAELLEFLNMAGGWGTSPGAGFLYDGRPPTPAERCPVSEFWEWQDTCKLLMTNPLAFWSEVYPRLDQAKREVLNDFTVRLQVTVENKRFQAITRVWGTLRLILLSIFIDLLNRAKFRQCARPDCFGIFQIETRHRRIYCSQYCGHLESVRRNRRTNKKAFKGGGAQR
jgi:hypothetical protein